MGLARLILFGCLIFTMPAAAQTSDDKGLIETAPGVSIYFERYGSGPEFVLIPGRLFMPQFAALARPNRTLVLYDMRNRGLSRRVEESSKITIIGDTDDVEALRRHFGAEKMSLIGFSYLGLMTALYATQHPERISRLVQIGPVPRKFDTSYPRDQEAGLETLNAEGQAARANWEAMEPKVSIDPKIRCQTNRLATSFALVGNPANHSKVPDTCEYENESVANLQRHFGAHFGDLQKRDFPREPFTKFEHPVLTLHGTMDRNAPYGSGLEWATTFRNGRLITVPGGAHALWLDEPQIITDIDQFLAGSWPARAQSFGRE